MTNIKKDYFFISIFKSDSYLAKTFYFDTQENFTNADTMFDIEKLDIEKLDKVVFNDYYTYYIKYDDIVDISSNTIHFKYQNVTFSDNIMNDIISRYREYIINKLISQI